MVYFKENYILSRLQGVQHFKRGQTFSRDGVGAYFNGNLQNL